MPFEIMSHSGLCRIRYSASRANVVRDNVVRVYDVRDFVVPPPPRTRTMDRTTQNYGDNGHVSVRKVISKS